MTSFPVDESGSGFPSPVPLPAEIGEHRSARTRRLVRAAGIGIGVRLFVVLVEAGGYWVLGHSVLLVDAVATAADVIASLLIILAIKVAERPPDSEHPFGHGRYEPLAGLQLGVLISLLGVGLFIQQSGAAIRHPVAGLVQARAWMIPLAAAVLLEVTCRLVKRVARRESSTALLAEAHHFRVDAITSLLAGIGLIIATQIPAYAHLADHLFSMVLAAIMIGFGGVAAVENLNQIMDRTPDPASFERVRSTSLGVVGVLEVEKIRIQRAGPDAHVDIDIEVDPESSVRAAHSIAQQVRAAIQTDWPAVRDVTVHVEPFYEGDHAPPCAD
ncbi:MAG: cation diffusion facilitator family transporter [Pirellulaceae bacterium]|nr:cation diffusion facilitator family transporter [Pirellulaceae bacterium]